MRLPRACSARRGFPHSPPPSEHPTPLQASRRLSAGLSDHSNTSQHRDHHQNDRYCYRRGSRLRRAYNETLTGVTETFDMVCGTGTAWLKNAS